MHHRLDASRIAGSAGPRVSDAIGGDVDELILYAVPEGSFAASCTEYWERTQAEERETVAQSYPPHCTLTGFFRRHRTRLDSVLEDLERAVPNTTIPADGVRGKLTMIGGWVGFQLEALPFEAVISGFVQEHQAHNDEDSLRPKSWLHLSLAYGEGTDVEWHRRVALEVFDGAPSSPWSIGLWRRVGDTWERLDVGSR